MRAARDEHNYPIVLQHYKYINLLEPSSRLYYYLKSFFLPTAASTSQVRVIT